MASQQVYKGNCPCGTSVWVDGLHFWAVRQPPNGLRLGNKGFCPVCGAELGVDLKRTPKPWHIPRKTT